MKSSIFRSPWFTLGVLVVVFALSFTYWTGCSQRDETLSAPTVGQQTVVFDKLNPQVQAAIAVQTRHMDKLMENPDVVGTGVGIGDNGKPVVLILTRKDDVQNIPAVIEGFRTRIDVVGEVRALAKGYKGTYRPVPGGVSVGNDKECAAGTIGCVILSGGTRYALSNNHVFARVNAASIGERIDQPGRYDGRPICSQTGQVAFLSDFKPISFSGNNEIDAAIAELTVDNVCSMVDNLYTPSSTPVSPSVGLAVKKVGRTSGLTTGTIAGINVTINVSYGGGRIARFVNQIYVASVFIRAGDSGSLMVTRDGNNPVGLNFAGGSGSSFANPIEPVLSYFHARVCSN